MTITYPNSLPPHAARMHVKTTNQVIPRAYSLSWSPTVTMPPAMLITESYEKSRKETFVALGALHVVFSAPLPELAPFGPSCESAALLAPRGSCLTAVRWHVDAWEMDGKTGRTIRKRLADADV